MSTAPTQGLSISEAADRTGLSADTLRYYERIGLMDPVPRSASGQRVYGEGELDRLELINRLRDTGMPIRGMLEYARLVRRGPEAAARRRGMLVEHRKRLRAEMERTEETVRYLDYKIGVYDELLAGEADDRPAAGG
ncbi:MerR family transcriptional regulator [Streptomonospora salina]|uniref:DNA-binding transcriptional MerR regulator n=1 Tax=Streptomonospora salina TaxID=104205 RepID=A0A841EAQ4_9ACTN|nr:MerR family transcriptional regulator [Streptomonospora salina]MBB6001107.1 DNA-binding transcriptional MerR regulator [Streptomonospora salina]